MYIRGKYRPLASHSLVAGRIRGRHSKPGLAKTKAANRIADGDGDADGDADADEGLSTCAHEDPLRSVRAGYGEAPVICTCTM